MRTAESGQEVIQRIIVRQVNRRQLEAPLILVALEQIIEPQRQVEQVARGDAGRVVVVVLGIGRRYLDERRAKLGSRTVEGQGLGRGCMYAIAGEPRLKLLVSGQGNAPHIGSDHAHIRYTIDEH